MNFLTLNLNGIRSALKKGLCSWLTELDADVIFLQEIRIQKTDLELSSVFPGYHCVVNHAVKPGYSGTALLAKTHFDQVIINPHTLSLEDEGRIIQADLGRYRLVNCYLPSGSSSEVRQELKLRYIEEFFSYIQSLPSNKPLIIGGDFNIAHTQADIKNWKSNQNNSGFTPQERDWMTRFIDRLNMVDTLRYLNPLPKDEYTWWSNRANAYANNVGWRIDYFFVSNDLSSELQSYRIYREPRFSDHAAYAISLRT